MSEGVQHFSLTAPPPLRAAAIAAVTLVVGMGLMIAALELDLGPVASVGGVVVIALAVALWATARILTARAAASLTLDDEAVTVARGGRQERLPWAEIETVTLTGPRLTLVRKSGSDVAVLNPRTPDDPTFAALLAAISRRLDASRGYRRAELE